MPMFCFFPMECRRWASISDLAGCIFLLFPLAIFDGIVGLTDLGRWSGMIVGMRVSCANHSSASAFAQTLTGFRIVEYATREQAQNAISTLSNQSLMGRLVYVREAGHAPSKPLPFLVTSVPLNNPSVS
jgi:hypothetical protein